MNLPHFTADASLTHPEHHSYGVSVTGAGAVQPQLPVEGKKKCPSGTRLCCGTVCVSKELQCGPC